MLQLRQLQLEQRVATTFIGYQEFEKWILESTITTFKT
jgi:hypothetical protein